jgi:hypothetical protein
MVIVVSIFLGKHTGGRMHIQHPLGASYEVCVLLLEPFDSGHWFTPKYPQKHLEVAQVRNRPELMKEQTSINFVRLTIVRLRLSHQEVMKPLDKECIITSFTTSLLSSIYSADCSSV